MRVLHDSSDIRFRDPFGAIQVGGAVTLSLEVWDAPDAVCWLRVWVDGQGEKLVRMHSCALDGRYAPKTDGPSPQRENAASVSEAPARHVVRLDFDEQAIVWYHFVIERKDLSLRFRGSSNQRLIDVPASLNAGEVVLWDN